MLHEKLKKNEDAIPTFKKKKCMRERYTEIKKPKLVKFNLQVQFTFLITLISNKITMFSKKI